MERLLKAKRVLNGINQSEIAKVLNICTYSYCKKENGTQDFTQSEIKKLINFFNLSMEETNKIFFA